MPAGDPFMADDVQRAISVRFKLIQSAELGLRKKMPTGDPSMADDVQRAMSIRFKMSQSAELGVVKKAMVDDPFLDDAAPTTESNISDPDALNGGGSTSMLFIIPLPTS